MGDELDRIVPAAAANSAGALVGLVVGGPLGAVGGAALGPALEPIMRRVWGELHPESQLAAAQVLIAAAEHADQTPAQLTDHILADPQRRLLAGIALDAGSRTRTERKIRALGRALADGVLASDDARLDLEGLIIAALAELEAPHIAVLELVAGFTPFGDAPHPYTGEDRSDPGAPHRRWALFELNSARPGLRAGMPSIVSTLARHGLIHEYQALRDVLEQTVWGPQPTPGRPSVLSPRPPRRPSSMSVPPQRWEVTELGETVLGYLTDAADEPEAT